MFGRIKVDKKNVLVSDCDKIDNMDLDQLLVIRMFLYRHHGEASIYRQIAENESEINSYKRLVQSKIRGEKHQLNF